MKNPPHPTPPEKPGSAVAELLQQKKLLQIEYEEEKNEFTKIKELQGVDKLKSRGNAWTDIRLIRTYYNSLNQRVIEIQRPEADEDDDHNFEYGRPVMFFAVSSGFNASFRPLFKGEVSYVYGNRMVAVVSEEADVSLLSERRDAGVMLSFDETSYRAMFDAIDYTINAKGRLGELRDFIYSKAPVSKLSLTPMHFPYLNKDQEEAVNNVLQAKDVAIVHGPPGTGKTTTLVEAIYETLRREPQVLVCAQSNMAVDWISEKLVDRGLNVLRIGNPSRVNDKMLSFTYERRFEAHPAYPDLWGLRKTIRQLYKDRNKTESWHQKIDRLKSRATELEIRINNDLFSQAHVIASTLVSSSGRLLQGMTFPTLFIDEAAQALEPATWIPIRRAGRVILAGDHCQLPATVKSYQALKGGLGKSLMERIVEKHPDCVKLLTKQYRMHQDIMNFSSRWFYGGKMTAAPEVKYRSILDFDTPIEWIDTSDPDIFRRLTCTSDHDENVSPSPFTDEPEFEETVTRNFGKINKEEALLTLITVKGYIEKIGISRFIEEKLDIGIISPYRAQTQYLRMLLKRDRFFKPLRKLISINTVDGFQGQERDIIVISMVRSNEEGQIGFLRDLRRMNVAMTRARMKLLIIGNSKTLSTNNFYSQLYGYIQSL
ncbi:MAG: AAA family ATPase [Muribaculaceae bacterium]|nr:AAA family ATPase [Muribaculaceae bacterium]